MQGAPHDTTYGLVAEYASAAELARACALVRAAGYRRWDAHSPCFVPGLASSMGLESSPVPWVALVCGLGGAGLALAGQLLAGATRPGAGAGPTFVSTWPALVPITVEVGLLCAALGAFFAVLWLSRLPRWHHPLFGLRSFGGATDDRFFVTIEASDPAYDPEATVEFLRGTGALNVEIVIDE
jgi:hypothetical protein